MAQHYTQSKAHRDLPMSTIFKMTEQQAWEKFAEIRWGSLTAMKCPFCEIFDRHYRRRSRKQWRCKHCDRVFSVTTGTPFAYRKLPFEKLLQAIYLFSGLSKGLSSNNGHALINTTFRTLLLNFGKIREALFITQERSPLDGTIQVDGGHFCGKPRRPRKRNRASSATVNHHLKNRKASIVPLNEYKKMEPWNAEKFKKRRVVLVLRQLSDQPGEGAVRTVTAILTAENARNVIPIIKKYVASGATIQSDDSHAFTSLSAWYDHKTVRHSTEYCTDDGTNNNQAESYFSRLRRMEYGTYHGMRPQYLAFYAAEAAWREDVRRISLQQKFNDLCKRILSCDMSKTWQGYAQGKRLGFEYVG